MFDAPFQPDTSLMQTSVFADALRICGQSPVALPGGLTLLHRRIAGVPIAMLPRADPPPDLKQQLRQIGLQRTPLIVSPETFGRGIGLPLRKPVQTARIDLTQDMPTRRAALHSKWRNQLCRAERSLLRVRSGHLRADNDLPERDAVQARNRGYQTWPPGLTHAFAQIAPHQTQLFTATLRGHPVAEMLFLLHGDRASYHIGMTTSDGRAHCAHNLILWQAQNDLARLGIQSIDLGTLHPRTPDLNRFKIRGGGVAFQNGGTFLYWTPQARRG